MLEAKAKDLALVRLRRDLIRYAPEVATRFGVPTDKASESDVDLEVDAADLPFEAN